MALGYFILQVYICSLSVTLPWNYIYNPYEELLSGRLNSGMMPWNIIVIFVFNIIFLFPLSIANLFLLFFYNKFGIFRQTEGFLKSLFYGMGMILGIYILTSILFFIIDILLPDSPKSDSLLYSYHKLILPFGPLMILGFLFGNVIFLILNLIRVKLIGFKRSNSN